MDGFLFGYLRRKAINDRKGRLTYEQEIDQLLAQRDALLEVIWTLVPDHDTRRDYVNPLYHKLLREECEKRKIPFPNFD